MFTDGEIQYFWLTFDEFTSGVDDYTGAVGCKITTGAPQETQVHQWEGTQELAKNDKTVAGRVWKNQGKENRMADPAYFAQPWYEDSYSVQESNRTSGDYSIQWCEVEVILDEKLPKELTFEMQMGVRFYADSDATTFVSTGQPTFEWYREEMSFSKELNEEPVYEDKQTKKQAEEVFEITVEDVFAAFMDAYNAYLEALAAAEAEANSTDDSGAETQSSMAIGFRNKQETQLSASQTYSNGFSLYDGITASDWWTWTLAVDMPVGMIGDDYILYQWATMINQDDAEDTFTIACVRTIGDDETMSARIYTQDSSSQTALYPDDSDNVVGLAWDSQAPLYLEED